jgi:hypothetical protein
MLQLTAKKTLKKSFEKWFHLARFESGSLIFIMFFGHPAYRSSGKQRQLFERISASFAFAANRDLCRVEKDF